MRIDVRAEFDRTIEQMEWDEVLDTLQVVIEDALGLTPDPIPMTPPPPALTTELGYDIHPEPVGDVHEAHGGCSCHHLGIAPHSFEQPVMAAPNIMQTGPLSHSQGQNTLYQWTEYDPTGQSTAAYYTAAPPHTYNNALVITSFENTGQNLVPLQVLNGEVVYAYALNPNSAAPPAPTSKKRRRYNKRHDEDQPYIKKPLNAFMLFMKEQRQKVVAEIKIRDNATVNSVLGQRWASLSQEDKAKYFEQAEEERLLHARHNPGWSSSDNYGKKRKKPRRKLPSAAESSVFKPEHGQPQMEQTALMKALTLNAPLEMSYTQDTDTLLYSTDKVPWIELFLSS
ncbi:hypothetical protein Q8A73_021238 [Channa argus]|nr:hypothetical protein Q8A73_021238 [Channa argus]